jgi:hypothetical protein
MRLGSTDDPLTFYLRARAAIEFADRLRAATIRDAGCLR